jgi:hypothetical protein
MFHRRVLRQILSPHKRGLDAMGEPYPALVPQRTRDSDGARIVPALRACVLSEPDIFTRIPKIVSYQGLVVICGGFYGFTGGSWVRCFGSPGPAAAGVFWIHPGVFGLNLINAMFME